jgi:hypothetical protein
VREESASRRGALLGVSALAALVLSGLGPSVARAEGPTINVVYTTNSLQVKLSDGTVVTGGTVIPAGSYTIQVYDSGDFPTPKFTMSGPGVSISSDLNSTGMGLDVPTTFGPLNLQTTSSYAVSDANMGAGSRVAFTTSATVGASSGSSSSGSSSSSSSSSGGSSSSSSGSHSSSSSSSSGSKAAKTLGTLKLSVGASGKPTLTFGGKAVKTLKAGKYAVKVTDRSKKAGVIVGYGVVRPTTLSGVAAVGTRSRTLTLKAGKWFVEASMGGRKTYFTVK